MSLTFNPRKRNSGFIDNDFIALLTFPAVAAAHLVFLVHAYPGLKDEIVTTEERSALERIAAIEAPLVVAETLVAISVILFLIAVGLKCIRRASFVSLVGCYLCYTAE